MEIIFENASITVDFHFLSRSMIANHCICVRGDIFQEFFVIEAVLKKE